MNHAEMLRKQQGFGWNVKALLILEFCTPSLFHGAGSAMWRGYRERRTGLALAGCPGPSLVVPAACGAALTPEGCCGHCSWE